VLYTESANRYFCKNQNNTGAYLVNFNSTGSLKYSGGGYHSQLTLLSEGSKAYAIETNVQAPPTQETIA
jgi:hypothetical protein